MKLLAPVLLLVFGSLAEAEVVQSFQETCRDYFLRNTPPTVLQGQEYKQICQKYKGNYYFATLYDTKKRIPVYSAYQFKGYMQCGRSDRWFIEPQLDDPNQGSDMALMSEVPRPPRGDNQALNSDYYQSNYHKGHLAPVLHSSSQKCANATFTLTNAVPQIPKFNQGPWKRTEKAIADELKNHCVKQKYRAYIVTGVVPGTKYINNRVNVPEYFWSAYCCVDNNDKVQFSGAYWGPQNSPSDPPKTTVNNLNNNLTRYYNVHFKVFDFNSNVCGSHSDLSVPP